MRSALHLSVFMRESSCSWRSTAALFDRAHASAVIAMSIFIFSMIIFLNFMTIVLKTPLKVSTFSGVVLRKYDDSIILLVFNLAEGPFSVAVIELVEDGPIAFPWNCDFYKMFLSFVELAIVREDDFHRRFFPVPYECQNLRANIVDVARKSLVERKKFVVCLVCGIGFSRLPVL